jgi:uncharacterized tellurite resistance protein B-like protein
MIRNYQLGLLYLVKLLIDADGIADEKELEALRVIKERENIPDDIYNTFEFEIKQLKDREVYNAGLAHLHQCSHEEKLNVFTILYKLSEVDGRVHLKEIKLLLYSIKTAGLELDDVVTNAKGTPAIM